MFCQHCGNELKDSGQFCQQCGSSTSSGSTSPYHVASLGRRFANNFLDSFFIWVINIALIVLATTKPNYGSVYFFTWVTALLYYTVFEAVWQRTPAKWITGTKVVDREGNKPSLGKIVGRTFARIIPFDALSFLFGPPIGWHDSLTKTLVVPSEYTPEQVAAINTSAYPRSKTRTVVIIIVISLIGIAIIGILASVVLLSLNSARMKSRDAQRVTDIRQIAAALELYKDSRNSYPQKLEQLVPTYISSLPTAPTPADGTCTDAQNTYTYTVAVSTYSLSYCLGEATGGFEAGSHISTPYGESSPTTSLETDYDQVEQADFDEGYRAGYVDGRGRNAQVGDTFTPPASTERRAAYTKGYLEGFSVGCHEGNFDDCAAVDQYIAELSSDSQALPPQLR